MTPPDDLGNVPDIRFNRVEMEGQELAYVQESMLGGHAASGGPFAKRAAGIIAEEAGAAEVLMTTSCTAALELSAMLLDLGPGDTVIVPSFTFTTTALAYVRQGAGLVFCDVEPRTLGLDPEHLATLMDETVRAVVVVHYAGVACDIDGVKRVLEAWPDAVLIEDNAHGLYGRWHDQPLGSLGRFSSLSFHETKNFVCGEGGALVLNEERDVDRSRVLYDKGTNRQAFLLGQVDKYTWKDIGSSFGLADVLAAYLVAQLEQAQQIQAKRGAVHDAYMAALTPHADELGFQVMQVPEGCQPAYHLFYVLLEDRQQRNDVLETMGKMGVRATFHYQALHSSDAGRKFAVRSTECPVTDSVSDRLLRLPFYNNLTEGDQARVVDTFLTSVRSARKA